jgi:hypothetical protein
MGPHTIKKGIKSEEAFTCITCDITFTNDFMSKEPQICKACKRKEVPLVTNARVFVINYIGKDMSDAKQYGTLIPITEGNVDVFNIDRLLFTMRDILERYSYQPEKDFILLSGGLSLNWAMGMICSKYEKGNLLLWDAKNRKYIRKEFNR